MKKVILCLVLIFASLPIQVFAEEASDELAKYDGYGKAVYEHMTDLQYYVAGKYTNNVDYVRQAHEEFNENKRKAAQYFQDYINQGDTPMEKLNNFAYQVVGGAVTGVEMLWDALTFWKDENEKNIVEEIVVNNGIFTEGHWIVDVNPDYIVRLNKEVRGRRDFSGSIAIAQDFRNYKLSVEMHSITLAVMSFENNDEFKAYYFEHQSHMFKVKDILSQAGLSMSFVHKATAEEFSPVKITNKNPTFTQIYNYVNSGGVADKIPDTYKPDIRARMACPSGAQNLTIDGSTFKLPDGVTIDIPYSGKVTYNAENCQLEWITPKVDYDKNDNVIVSHQDGKSPLDLEQNLPLECDGVFCFLTKLTTAVTDLVGKLLDGIMALFVPSDLGFVTTEMNNIKDALTAKISITEDIKTMLTGLFVSSDVNPLQNVTLNLPILNKPVSFGDLSFINEYVPIARRVLSAVLWLMTITYVYRKIVGRGGVMEK